MRATYTKIERGFYRVTFTPPGNTKGGGCWVRKTYAWPSSVGPVWETAEFTDRFEDAKFSACPIAGASDTRQSAVNAFYWYITGSHSMSTTEQQRGSHDNRHDGASCDVR